MMGIIVRGENMSLERRIERTLLVDADDTLWECNIYYSQCTHDFGEHMASLDFDIEQARTIQSVAELEVISEYGYSPEGYVRSLELTYERLAQQAGLNANPAEITRIAEYAEVVLKPRMVLLDHVQETLASLKPSSKLVLVTKGDQNHQQSKVDHSGLSHLFDAQYIVPEKHDQTYVEIARKETLDWANTWMIGNSPRSDINPAVRAGLSAIYIPHPASWVAELEPIEQPECVIVLSRFADLLGYFGVQAQGS